MSYEIWTIDQAGIHFHATGIEEKHVAFKQAQRLAGGKSRTTFVPHYGPSSCAYVGPHVTATIAEKRR